LFYEDINKFLANIAEVDYKYLLTTTHIVEEYFVNTDINTRDFKLKNLFTEPFNFRNETIIECVSDNPPGYHTPRQMVLAAKKNVPNNINYKA
jgi:hypothetical protein